MRRIFKEIDHLEPYNPKIFSGARRARGAYGAGGGAHLRCAHMRVWTVEEYG